MGNVSDLDGISSLTYSVSRGTPVQLSIWLDNPRLNNEGDFNADIIFQDLLSGQNEVVITAFENLNNQSVEMVYVTCDFENIWPGTYSADWNLVEDIAQVVDVKWKIENGAVRTEEPRYDRLIAIWDDSRNDFEATINVKLHNYTYGPFSPSGFGLIMRWGGHYSWDDYTQPCRG